VKPRWGIIAAFSMEVELSMIYSKTRAEWILSRPLMGTHNKGPINFLKFKKLGTDPHEGPTREWFESRIYNSARPTMLKEVFSVPLDKLQGPSSSIRHMLRRIGTEISQETMASDSETQFKVIVQCSTGRPPKSNPLGRLWFKFMIHQRHDLHFRFHSLRLAK